MITSPLGAGVPPGGLHNPTPEIAVDQLRLQIGKMSDCLQRALDGLARDDAARVDWVYVGGQLTAVCVFGSNGVKLATSQAVAAQEAEAPDTPLTPVKRDLFADVPNDAPYGKGGVS